MSFDPYALKQHSTNLAGGKPYTNPQVNLVYPTSSPTDNTSFSGADLVFIFENSNQKWAITDEIRLNVDYSLTNGVGGLLAGGIALAPSPGNLFESVRFDIIEQNVEFIESGAVAFADGFYKRAYRSGDWLRGYGGSTEGWNSFAERDAYAQSNLKGTMSWSIPLSVFNTQENGYLPLGRYRITMKPNPNFLKSIVQSTAPATPGTDYIFSINKVVLMTPIVYGVKLASDINYLLDLVKRNVQRRPIVSTTGSQSFNFIVPASTFRIGVAFTNAIPNSTAPQALFKLTGNQDLELTDCYVEFRGQQKPSSSLRSLGATGNGLQVAASTRYSYTYNTMKFENNDPESLAEFVERGPYLLIDFSPDRSDRSTSCQVNFTFAVAPTVDATNSPTLLLYTESRAAATVAIVNEAVQTVSVADA